MNYIYLLTYDFGDGSATVGAYSTLDGAKKAMDEGVGSFYYGGHYGVEQWEVDSNRLVRSWEFL